MVTTNENGTNIYVKYKLMGQGSFLFSFLYSLKMAGKHSVLVLPVYVNSNNCTLALSNVMWKNRNSLIHHNRSSGTVENIMLNGTELTGCSLANAFNEHFVNIAITTQTNNA